VLLFLSVGLVLFRSEITGGRDDAAIAEALAAMARVLAHANNQVAVGHRDHGEVEKRRLDRFLRNNPPTFKGRFCNTLFSQL